MAINNTSDNTENSHTSENNMISVDNAEVNAEEMKNSPLHRFFLRTLQEIYSAEHDLFEALGEMQESATTAKLKTAFKDHQLQTRDHITRLEKVFELVHEKPERKEGGAIKGIIAGGRAAAGSIAAGSLTRDAALIIAAQQAEHYEIATYGGLAQLAKTMGHDKAAELLKKTLQEEEDTDYHLTGIAETTINFDAQQED